ncbi:MAG: hypothetical protein EWV80_00290 [Microcystis aeruginosa Ma_QC_B_20070730_S2]|jgi:hypothetical protein|uniref:Uncharacterized protein n=1 Tax=Microcystis aeruginosa Ma_QC_B_20070730_S2 TaxID=2486256 RepID=A0A552EBB1_MICAE|nr:MAG: hypothetical protein EWV80_00290 [Microcystis aeruginosa Ma_QC_B_20070730_S2]
MALTPEEKRRISIMLDQMDQSTFQRVVASFKSFIAWLRSIDWDDVADKLIKAFELLRQGIELATAFANFLNQFRF